jgi:hypothetical protein
MRRDVTRFKKTYSFHRQSTDVLDLRFRKSYSFTRQQPRLDEYFILTEDRDFITTENGDELIP